MAYMNQEKKKALAPAIKAVLKKYGVKGTLGVRNHSTLVMNISAGPIDFIGNYNAIQTAKALGRDFAVREDNMQINPYWYKEQFDGKAGEFLGELMPLMNVGNHDNSDIQSDYFDVGWYVNVNIGDWNKPYIFTGEK